MKKVLYNEYGSLQKLQIAQVDIPAISKTGILVKVKAVSINPLDWKMWEGQMKPMSGFKFPKGVGIDFTGIVDKVGSAIQNYKVGDEIIGTLDPFKGGALAEYIAVTENEIMLKPSSISFEQAAAIPVVGSAALQILNELTTINHGTEVLINGASGGIGMFLTQLAKMKGAVVTSVVSDKGVAFVQKWGSDFVINYKSTNILNAGKKYDVVVDLSGKLPFGKAKAIMKTKSVYVNSIPGPKEIIVSFFHNLFSQKKYKILLLKQTKENLKTLAEYADNELDIVIDKTYPMESFKEGYSEVKNESIIGKAVITI